MKGADFLQPATPSIATITVSNLLQTSVRVKAAHTRGAARARISIDARNYQVFEYTFSFLINGQTVEIPFPVVVDPRTHEIIQLPDVVPYHLPPVNQVLPPRWEPPGMFAFDLGGGDLPRVLPTSHRDRRSGRAALDSRRTDHSEQPGRAARVRGHHADVTNGAPAGSTVTLDSVTALMKPPPPLRTVKSSPSVAFNQPVPIVDATTGVTFLVAQARGEAEWTMEGLQPGTHTSKSRCVRRTSPPVRPTSDEGNGSRLGGRPRSALQHHLLHPDTVRKDIEYTTFSFITNMSGSAQNIKVTNGLPACADSPGSNVCRVDGTPATHDLSIPAGEMRTVEYKLKPGITGHVFATRAPSATKRSRRPSSCIWESAKAASRSLPRRWSCRTTRGS